MSPENGKIVCPEYKDFTSFPLVEDMENSP